MTDAGANIIYRLKQGEIKRFAGAIGVLRNDVGDRGGYKNGPVQAALFQRPSAAIERHDGGVYVADTGNHCIRLIDHGQVRLYAGSTDAGSADGTLETVHFKNPIALALNADGTLLVVDYGVGVRKISPDGHVTTLPYGSADKKILGIATATINGHSLIAYTEIDSVHLVVDDKDTALKASDERMPTHEGIPIFHAWGIAIVNENSVVVTDPMTSVIRLIRFPTLPYTDIPASEALSGTLHEDTDFNGGFRDGNNTEALYAAPRGLSVDARGEIIIADSGNRRIRRLSGFDTRESVLPDFSNFEPAVAKTNVVLIGQSALFNGVLYPDSIAASAEATFDGAAHDSQLKRRVHVQTIRIDGVDFKTMKDVVNTYVADRGSIDVIVFVLNSGTYAQVNDLIDEANLLTLQHIRTVVALFPGYVELSPVELPYNGCACIFPADTIDLFRRRYLTLEGAYKAAGLQTISLVGSMNSLEAKSDRTALFDMNDTHYTPAGQRALGSLLAKEMLANQEWEQHSTLPLKTIETAQAETCPHSEDAGPPPSVGVLSKISTTNQDRLGANASLKTQDLPVFEGWQTYLPLAAKELVCISVDGFTGISAQTMIHQISFDGFETTKQIEYATSGYRVTMTQPLLPGKHVLGIAIIGSDGIAHLQPGSVEVEVK